MSGQSRNRARIRAFYRALTQAWGPQHWWPARTRFEVIVGAYLTQNTSWTNVERAIQQLRREGLLSLAAIRQAPVQRLEQAIRPAGYFRQKTRRLKTFVEFLDSRYRGSLDRMFARSTPELREELLGLNGVGPETADSILLYAGNHPVFVVDAYTRRILDRHGILPVSATYEEARELVEKSFQVSSLKFQDQDSSAAERETRDGQRGTPVKGAAHPPSPMSTCKRTELVQILNEMHGLIVGVGKNYCLKAKPHCSGCPLERFLR